MDADPSVESLVRRFYDVIDARQWDEQETLVADDFTAHLSGSPPISFGEWQHKIKSFYDGFPDGHHRLEFLRVEGDRILTVGRFIGSHTGDFMGHAPSGAAIAMGVMHLDRVVGRKIVDHTTSANLLGLLQQIGSGATGARLA